MKSTIQLIFFFLISAVIFFSCKSYYKISSGQISSIDSLANRHRVFILRSGSDAWLIKNLILSPDKNTIRCKLDILPSNHGYHLGYNNKQSLTYSRSDLNQREVVNEVHFYTSFDSLAKSGDYLLAINTIYKIEILEHDIKRTTTSKVVGAILITAGVAAITLVIAAALKSSCPFISAWDGKDFSLQGEIYGGSIYPQLERKDYLALKMAPASDNSLQIKITNELKERQYTDHVQLWELTHPAGTRIMVDEYGKLRTVYAPQLPTKALLNNHLDILPALEKANDYKISAMDDTSTTDGQNEVTLRFKRPPGVNNGKLVLALKNSYFLDLLYGELAKGFGIYYASYMKEQKKKTREELLRWVKEQHIPLEIAVKTSTGWQTITALTTVGPLAFRETAIEIPLPENRTDQIEIRLQSGFQFWEIDYAAMDFTAPVDFTINKLEPVSAIDEKGNNVLSLLSKEDGKYLDQPQIGNAATIRFLAASATEKGKEKTYILETKGYYEHLRDFTNPPNIQFLESFKKPGAFPLFGLKMYKELQTEKLNIAATN